MRNRRPKKQKKNQATSMIFWKIYNNFKCKLTHTHTCNCSDSFYRFKRYFSHAFSPPFYPAPATSRLDVHQGHSAHKGIIQVLKR